MQSDTRALGNTLCVKAAGGIPRPLRFNEIQVYMADGSVIPSAAMTSASTSIAQKDGSIPLPLPGCFDGDFNSSGCGPDDADANRSMRINVTCGVSGHITAGASKVVIYPTVSDNTRATAFTVQAVNSDGGIYDTFALDGPAATHELWMSKDLCRPGQGGADCAPCARGLYSAAASPTAPKPECLECNSDSTTDSVGAQSVGMCSSGCLPTV